MQSVIIASRHNAKCFAAPLLQCGMSTSLCKQPQFLLDVHDIQVTARCTHLGPILVATRLAAVL